MCAETPLSAGAAMHSAAGVRVEHGACHIIRGFRSPVFYGDGRRMFSAGFLPVGFCRRVFHRRVFVVERLLPGSCLSAFVAGFSTAGFLSLSVFCRVPACRLLSPGFPPQGSCSRAFAAGFPAAGFPPCILSPPGLRRVGPDGTMLSGSYCDPGESRRSSPAPSLSTIRDGA